MVAQPSALGGQVSAARRMGRGLCLTCHGHQIAITGAITIIIRQVDS